MATNHFISLQQAINMTTLFRAQRENILALTYKDKNILPLSETFDRAAIDSILQEDGCTAVRIYYGMGEDFLVHAILVGVNEDNADILPASNSLEMAGSANSDDEVIVEIGIRCPTDCPPPSDLNS